MVLLAGLCMMILISCKKEEKTPIIEQNIEVTPPAVEEAKDSIAIQIGKDGVDISTKSGANSTNISVGGGAKATTEVKK